MVKIDELPLPGFLDHPCLHVTCGFTLAPSWRTRLGPIGCAQLAGRGRRVRYGSDGMRPAPWRAYRAFEAYGVGGKIWNGSLGGATP